MEREIEQRYKRMEALLHAGIERGNEMELRFHERMQKAEEKAERGYRESMRRHDEAMLRMEKADEKAERRHQEAMRRMDRAEHRMEKFDQRLEATRKLVEAGMKIVLDNGRRQKALEETVRELSKSQKAFLDSLIRRGGNGHGRPS